MTNSVQATTSSDGFSSARRRIGKFAAYACTAIAVYIVSIGPAYSLTGFQLNGIDSASRSQQACEVIYRPIYVASRQSTSIKGTVSTYLGLWSH